MLEPLKKEIGIETIDILFQGIDSFIVPNRDCNQFAKKTFITN